MDARSFRSIYNEKTLSLSKLMLGQQCYDELYAFFRDSWGLENGAVDYSYRVYTARKCFNLNELFFSIYMHDIANTSFEEKALDIRRRTFMTHHGLFCCVPDLIDEFRLHNRFPRILIVDELVIYGHEITNIICTLEDMVCEFFSNLPDDEQTMIRDKLLKSIDVIVFGREQKQPLIPGRIFSRIKFEKEMTGSQWRIYIQNVAQLLNRLGSLRNKSYLPVFSLPANRAKTTYASSHNWDYYKLRYHGINTYIWMHSVYPHDSEAYTVRAISARATNDFVYYLPTFFLGDMTLSDAKIFLNFFAGQIESMVGSDNRLVTFLCNPFEKLLTVQFQLILCILSCVSYCDFLKKYDIPIAYDLQGVDIDRVCMNFGSQNKLIDDFGNLFDCILHNYAESSPLYIDLMEYADKFLSTHAIPLFTSNGHNSKTSDFSGIILDSEDYLQMISYKDEIYTSEMRVSDGIFSTATPKRSAIALRQYLRRTGSQGYIEALIVMLLFSDDGIASTNLQVSQDGKHIQMRLKAGELAGFSTLKKFYRFIPALIELELFCELFSFNAVYMADQFGRCLERYFPDYCCVSDGIRDLISRQYNLSHEMRDWRDVDLLFDLDSPETARNGVFSTRTLQPWSKKTWRIEERIKVAGLSVGDYVEYEKGKQAELVKLFHKFINGFI